MLTSPLYERLKIAEKQIQSKADLLTFLNSFKNYFYTKLKNECESSVMMKDLIRKIDEIDVLLASASCTDYPNLKMIAGYAALLVFE